MNPKQFLVGLGITTLIQCLVTGLLIWLVTSMHHHTGFIITTTVVMAGFCVMMYVAARIMANSNQTRLFIQLVMIAVFLKMLVCLALVVGYKKSFNPADDMFVWPFLIIYVSTTIYEVIFLEKVGRQKKITLP